MKPKTLEAVLKTLTYREREIIKRRYGLHDGTIYTLDEVAACFKITRGRARSIEAKALRKLQHPRRKEWLASISRGDEVSEKTA